MWALLCGAARHQPGTRSTFLPSPLTRHSLLVQATSPIERARRRRPASPRPSLVSVSSHRSAPSRPVLARSVLSRLVLRVPTGCTPPLLPAPKTCSPRCPGPHCFVLRCSGLRYPSRTPVTLGLFVHCFVVIIFPPVVFVCSCAYNTQFVL